MKQRNKDSGQDTRAANGWEDVQRKKKKKARAAASFLVTAALLLILFFAATNTGSLQIGFGKLLRGLFVEYDADVAAVWDLRFPRIIISMLAGAGIATSGVLFQAVLKIPLQIQALSVFPAEPVLLQC